MNESLEEKVKHIISMRRKVEAQLIFHQVAFDYKINETKNKHEQEIRNYECLLKGIDTLLLLISEEEHMLLQLHLVANMKWESVMEEYQRRWTYDKGADKRTYIYRQQVALKKIALYIKKYENKIDFSWMNDPFFDID